ncbi:threonine/homoserine/homoserine lactone efflux protein [Arthrobacter stackebrandtii]|uniref:Threonine/homoserine/homoserine lactone efflux protein n=1 Tax=Arthrobacter stackebrandtii TaxID=272161 RepID=A0ABS4YTY5_9MICC|nr:LysE family translocator [Arthrobacter stackebrandtii]MBP2411403.1 threonine/homoserine/homoserine lactone efflux protein [Arthrobacter stackebrandtii]PYH00310.1 lysine transporter LysE [Arthrobacter stackebrandtii]
MTFVSLVGFAGLCLMLALIPGPDTFLVLRISMSRASAGIAAAAGSAVGAIVWGALVGFGLAAVLEQSAEVFRWIKIAGGLYLMYLGISALVKARRARKAGLAAEPGAEAPLPYRRRTAFASGAVSTLLNPKVGLFYLAVVPQFIPHGGNTLGTALILGLTLAVIGFLYLMTIALVAHKTMKWLKKPKVNTVIERTSSGILAALGAGVLASGATS